MDAGQERENNQSDNILPAHRFSSFLRWSARILGLVMLAVFLMFFIGEGLSEPAGRPWRVSEMIAFALFPVGVAAGFLVGWRNERLGGGISVACLAAFYLADILFTGTLPSGPWFLVFSLPGFLFLAASLVRR